MDEKNNKPKIIVIAGPTASGKTALSIELAKKINGEIISADSMQIYKEMNIGTAKPKEEEKEGIQHYLLDFVSPDVRFSVSQYTKLAQEAIQIILNKHKVPIIVGGTGLYINSIIYGIQYNDIEIDLQYRKQLEKLADYKGLDILYEKALEIDSEAMRKISRNDKKRIIRVLEIYHKTGKTKTQMEIDSKKDEVKCDFHVFALQMDREKLYERINVRVDKMLEEGLIQEVEDIYNKYLDFPTAMQGIGYKEVILYLKEQISKDEMIKKIKQETRRYAKRQITWFKKIKSIIYLDALNSIQNNINIILEDYSEKEEKQIK